MSSGVPPQKLIKLSAPSVGFTGERIAHPTRLTRNFNIANGSSNAAMVAKVKEGDRHVVFNCHGHPAEGDNKAYLAIGQMLFEDNADVCIPWMRISTLRVIWLSACNIGGSGKAFCQRLAKLTGCYVATNNFAAFDRAVKPDTVEDNYRSQPHYLKPDGSDISRPDFIALGNKLGFVFP